MEVGLECKEEYIYNLFTSSQMQSYSVTGFAFMTALKSKHLREDFRKYIFS